MGEIHNPIIKNNSNNRRYLQLLRVPPWGGRFDRPKLYSWLFYLINTKRLVFEKPLVFKR